MKEENKQKKMYYIGSQNGLIKKYQFKHNPWGNNYYRRDKSDPNKPMMLEVEDAFIHIDQDTKEITIRATVYRTNVGRNTLKTNKVSVDVFDYYQKIIDQMYSNKDVMYTEEETMVIFNENKN